jgi:Cytochrome P450
MQTFTQAFYRLLAHPEYIEPLRQEAESAVAKEGWTRAGMDQMHKIDSFVRETQRIDSPIISPSYSFPHSILTDAPSLLLFVRVKWGWPVLPYAPSHFPTA